MTETPRTPSLTHRHAGAPHTTADHAGDYDRAAARENEIRRWFTYHAPRADQIDRYARLRDKALELALLINDLCPAGADQSAALRLLREAVMTANAAIAIGEATS